jgi:hypothetical protein
LTNLTSTGEAYALPAAERKAGWLRLAGSRAVPPCGCRTGDGEHIGGRPPTPTTSGNALSVTRQLRSQPIAPMSLYPRRATGKTLAELPPRAGAGPALQRVINHVNSGGHESPDGRRLVYYLTIPGLSYLMTRIPTGRTSGSLTITRIQYSAARLVAGRREPPVFFRHYTAEGNMSYVAAPAASDPNRSRNHGATEYRSALAHDRSGLIMNAVDPETHLLSSIMSLIPAARSARSCTVMQSIARRRPHTGRSNQRRRMILMEPPDDAGRGCSCKQHRGWYRALIYGLPTTNLLMTR